MAQYLVSKEGLKKRFIISSLISLFYLFNFIWNLEGVDAQHLTLINYFQGIFEAIVNFLFIFRLIEYLSFKSTISFMIHKKVTGKKAKKWAIIYLFIILLGFLAPLLIDYQWVQNEVITVNFYLENNNLPVDGIVYINQIQIGNTNNGEILLKKGDIEGQELIIRTFDLEYPVLAIFEVHNIKGKKLNMPISKEELRNTVILFNYDQHKIPINGELFCETKSIGDVENSRIIVDRDKLNCDNLVVKWNKDNKSQSNRIIITEDMLATHDLFTFNIEPG